MARIAGSISGSAVHGSLKTLGCRNLPFSLLIRRFSRFRSFSACRLDIRSLATGDCQRVILYAANHEGYRFLRRSGAVSYRASSGFRICGLLLVFRQLGKQGL